MLLVFHFETNRIYSGSKFLMLKHEQKSIKCLPFIILNRVVVFLDDCCLGFRMVLTSGTKCGREGAWVQVFAGFCRVFSLPMHVETNHLGACRYYFHACPKINFLKPHFENVFPKSSACNHLEIFGIPCESAEI